MRQLAAVWPPLFPAEQKRLAQLLIERVLIRRGTGGSGDDGMSRIRKRGDATVQLHMDRGAVKLSIFIPLQIRKHGVRKVVIRPDGESASPTARGQFDSPMPVALVRAFYWQQLLDDGVVASGAAISVREELLESLGFFLFAVLQRLRGLPRLLFATPALILSFPAFSFDLRLALPLLDEPRDFDRGLLQLPNNGWDPAGQVPGRCLSPLLGPICPRVRRVGLEAEAPGRKVVGARPTIVLRVPAASLGDEIGQANVFAVHIPGLGSL
ncbi:MAG TPA: hypothetical protein VIS76_13430 [Pseudomonadales bacterium]